MDPVGWCMLGSVVGMTGLLATMVHVANKEGKKPICDVWVENDRIMIEPYRPDRMLVQSLIKDIPMGTYAPTTGVWSFPLSMSTAGRIHDKLLKDGRYHQTFSDLVYGNRHSVEANKIKFIDEESLPDIPGLTRSAWGHQRKAYAYLRGVLGLDLPNGGAGGAGLFADMGCGKTIVTLGVIINSPQIKRVLLVCPKKVIEQETWTREVRKAIQPELRPRVYPLEGSTAERAEDIQYFANKPGIFVINYEALVYDNIQEAILSAKWDMVVLDEAHKIKAPNGKTSKFMMRLGTRVKYRVALTGTPNADKPLDVYGTYRFLDPTIFGTNYNNFKFQYAIMGGYQGREIKGYRDLEDLSSKMYSIAFRVTKDVLDLPETIDHIVRVKLSDRAREAYDSMKEDMVYSVADGSATVSNTLTKIVRLQQITSGYLPVDIFDPEEVDDKLVSKRTEFFEKDKQESLIEILQDMPEDQPIVVFCKFIYDIEQVKEAAAKTERPYLELSGRKSQLEEWENDPRYKNAVMAVQITAGGAGVDFTRAHYCCYFSLTHSLTAYSQSLSRIHRPGQTETVHYYYLTASNSIDVDIRQALKQKKNVAEYVLDRVTTGELSYDSEEV